PALAADGPDQRAGTPRRGRLGLFRDDGPAGGGHGRGGALSAGHRGHAAVGPGGARTGGDLRRVPRDGVGPRGSGGAAEAREGGTVDGGAARTGAGAAGSLGAAYVGRISSLTFVSDVECGEGRPPFFFIAVSPPGGRPPPHAPAPPEKTPATPPPPPPPHHHDAPTPH